MPERTTPSVDDYTVALAAELKAERAATGVTNEAIASAAGISPRQVVRIFNGEREMGASHAILITAALGIDVPTLVQRAEARISHSSK